MAFSSRNVQISGPFSFESGGGTTSTVQQYLFANTVDSDDPSSIVTTAVAEDNGIRVTLTGAGTATYSPSLGAWWEWDLKDFLGNTTSIELEDVFQMILRTIDPYLPTDTFMGVALTSGGMAAAGAGTFWGCRHNAGGNRAIVSLHAGTSWTAPSEATVTQDINRVFMGRQVQTNSISGCRTSTVPASAALNPANLTNAQTASVAGNVEVDGKFDRIAFVVGWAGVGGSNGDQVAGAFTTYTAPTREVSGALDQFKSVPAAPTDPVTKLLVIGNSNAEGVAADTDRGSGAITAGWSFNDDGVNITNYPSACGARPYIVDELVTAGATTGSRWVEWVGRNAMAMNPQAAVIDAMGDAMRYVYDRDDGDPHLIIIIMGENDCQDLTEAAQYLQSMRDMIVLLRYEYPDARILMWECSDADTGGSYPHREIIRGHQATLVNEFSSCELISAVGADLDDDVHYSPNSDGGFATMATRTGLRLVS